MSVRGTVVTGILRQTVLSRSESQGLRVLTPFTLRSVRALTSGTGGLPLTSPHRYAAARPLSTPPSPLAFTAAV